MTQPPCTRSSPTAPSSASTPSSPPLALLTCAFWIDWRLALLALSTLILYVLTYSVSLRGMNEKTVEMDRKLAAVSSSMVEFVSGIGVVKAFGRVGRAHSAYLTAADEFSSFYRAWAMPW